MNDAAPVVRLEGLAKTFRLGFVWSQRVEAVRGIDLEVMPGEVLGFLGPNGAGKTTTLKMLLGLIKPSKGTVELLGHPPDNPASRREVGFLPENPYFYGYLDGYEFLDLCGRLHGLDASTRRTRTEELLERVGLTGRADRALRRFSKGMLQRIGLAQALMGRPRLVVLDEPQSGLDPIGRRQVRDLIRNLADEGTAVFFSSHVLSDVEAVCDRVALMVDGRMRSVGPLHELVEHRVTTIDVSVTGDVRTFGVPAGLEARAREVSRDPERVRVSCGDPAASDAVVRAALAAGLSIEGVIPRRQSLEDVFVREATSSGAER